MVVRHDMAGAIDHLRQPNFPCVARTCRSALVRDALALVAFKGKSFRLPSAAELLSLCVAKEKVTKEKGHPAWRLPGILPGKSVSRGRAFRQHIHVLAKRHRHRATAPALPQLRHPCRRHVDARCAACRPRLTAAQGSGRAAGHPDPHCSEEPKQRQTASAHCRRYKQTLTLLPKWTAMQKLVLLVCFRPIGPLANGRFGGVHFSGSGKCWPYQISVCAQLA